MVSRAEMKKFSMQLFSIQKLQTLSLVRKHTLRIWEYRYGVFKPHRSSSNIRYYTINDLTYLLQLALLCRKGYRISVLSKMSSDALQQKISTLKDDDHRQQYAIHRLIECMYTADIETFEEVLDNAFLYWGAAVAIENVIMGFLERVEILSYNDSSCEVHFAVTAIRKKLIVGIEKENEPPAGAPKALLFLPKGEHFDLVLLYLTYVLKTMGIKVLYLGTNIAVENVKKMAIQKKPQLLLTYQVPGQRLEIGELSSFIETDLPHCHLFITDCEPSIKPTISNLNYIHYKSVNQLNMQAFITH
jgi:MerR family transcriptional regulator, light-induced transcriptional regulator